jgi:uncharacterized protein (TIGR02246 family)
MEAAMAETLKQTLINLEKKYWRALQEGDAETALKLTADPCIVTGAQGVARVSKKAFAGMLKNAEWEIEEFDISDAEVQELGDDVAIIAYKVHEKLNVDGEEVELEAADASTWVRKDGKWVCALHTESLSGDPYGRDRTRH